MPRSTDQNVYWVVVLGEFGRSPRMQYHTLSLCQKPNTAVYVLAYPGARPIQQLEAASNVHLVPMPTAPAFLSRVPRVLSLMLKVMLQVLQLLWLLLFSMPRPCSILVQNPPAIPTLALSWLAAKRHRAKLVIDWHNYGYTILALSMRANHWMVKLSKRYEHFWGKRAHRNFCVTNAMKTDLQDNWGIQAVTLHDRPPQWFQRSSLPQIHDLFVRLRPDFQDATYNDFLTNFYTTLPPDNQLGPARRGTAATSNGDKAPKMLPGSKSIITEVDGSGTVQFSAGRPAVVVSSTSWTADEDFSILLEAAKLYDAWAQEQQQATGGLPTRILFVITGRGPEREFYLQQIKELQLSHVAFRSLWLEPDDYPVLLGSADVGVSLHASSSGLDLPMKVVDMFGSGLPVCALAYSCINELVEDKETGLLFSNPQQLSEQLQLLLGGFPDQPAEMLQKLQQGVQSKQQSLRWQQNWDAVAWPVLKP